MKIELQRVHYMPQVLKPGILYVSEEFGAVAHLCPCGCSSKIRTPLGSTEWTLEEMENGPTLTPSIGNWQQKCRSHYWIYNGEVKWSWDWTPEQIDRGRRLEEKRRRMYYDTLTQQRRGTLYRFLVWVRNFINSN